MSKQCPSCSQRQGLPPNEHDLSCVLNDIEYVEALVEWKIGQNKHENIIYDHEIEERWSDHERKRIETLHSKTRSE